MSSYFKTAPAAKKLIKLWKAQCQREEALGQNLLAMPPAQAKLEGRRYFKMPLAELNANLDFFLRESTRMSWPIKEEEIPFLVHYFAEQDRRKRFRQEGEREFVVGFPTLYFSGSYRQMRLGSIFRFPLETLAAPKIRDRGFRDINGNLRIGEDQLTFTQESFVAKKGELPFWLDELIYNETLGIDEEKINSFRKAFAKKGLTAKEAIELACEHLFDSVLENEDPFTGLFEVLQKFLEGKQGPGKGRIQVFPYAVLYELEGGQPTRQLQTDLDDILIDNLLEEVTVDHPAMVYLTGQGNEKVVAEDIICQSTEHPLTKSQEEAMGHALGTRFTAIQGPPGTGKTHLIRNLAGQLFTNFIDTLNGPEDRAYSLDHVTVIASTNNRAVDNALEGLELEGHLPICLRAGSRPVLLRSTLPFLNNYLKELETQESEASRMEYKKLRPQLRELMKEATTDPTKRTEVYLLARKLHHYWAGANQNRIQDFLEEFCGEIEAKKGFKSLKKRKNLELFCSIFPVMGTTLLSIRNLFEMDEESLGFVIVDEAGQCNPSYVFPLLLRSYQAAILGDDLQLEPIARLALSEVEQLSKERKLGIDKEQIELFCTATDSLGSSMSLASGGTPKPLTLKEHFRCHKDIISISQQLCNYDLEVLSKCVEKEALFYQDVVGNEQRYGGSWVNEEELQALMMAVQGFLQSGWELQDMAILTPYRAQLARIRESLKQMGMPFHSGDFAEEGENSIAIGTVHRFQGGERKIVFFSPVIARGTPNFLNSRVNLLNVAVSRAQEKFVVVGSLDALQRGPFTSLLAKELLGKGVALGQNNQLTIS
ncbi:MAG: AAA domain-containing protein [SAR324 cluster bacterium]|nr:AAA domain-containing protein [SAR324 cluster bacterium]